jgi:SAM-dependent MidA family methyltransferase
MSSSLPQPDAAARAVSDALLARLQQSINEHDGCLPFQTFMDMALYEPGLGYYSNGLIPFGEGGDFITAPESGALFGRCLARCLASILAQLDAPCLLELGAGSGALAATVLEELDALDALPARYFILERSSAMRALQAESLQGVAAAEGRVEWLDALPETPVNGVVFGNEVADALPVRRFHWQDGEVHAVDVGYTNAQLSQCTVAADRSMADYVRRLADDYCWVHSYQSEYCDSLPAWIDGLCACIGTGALLLVDYGYGRAEYYHAQRSMGTLMCHYRHHAHADPLCLPGLQDITAFVDFTAVAEAATAAGMRLLGYTSQAQFLAACGIDRLMADVDPQDTRRFLTLANEAKRLLLPGEMGERFKCIAFARGLNRDVVGFMARDFRSRL